MMKLFDKFKPGQPVTAVHSGWFNGLASWFNNLRGEGVNCKVEVTRPENPSESDPPVIRVTVPRAQGGAELSDDTPKFDGGDDGAGSPGLDAKGARSDHIHPANVPFSPDLDITPAPVTIGPGAIGSSFVYARADHQHELGDSVLEEIDGIMGEAYQDVIDQVNDLLDSVSGYPAWTIPPGGYVNQKLVEGDLPVNTGTWSAGGSSGLEINVVTRVRYHEGDTTPQFLAYYRTLQFDQHGRLTGASTEGMYSVFVPVGLSV